MRIGVWFAVVGALGALVVRCGDSDTRQPNVGARGGQGGSSGDETGGTSGAPSAGEGGVPDAGGSGGTSARGGTTSRGGTASRGGSSGRDPTGGVSGDAGANAGAGADSGGSESGSGGESSGGSSMGGEGGAAGEDGMGGEPGCQDPPSTELCTGDLSGVGTGDFEVKFTVRTGGGPGWYALLGQRDVCGHSNFWSARLLEGTLYFELDDEGPTYAVCWSWIPLNDLQSHRVVVRRRSGVLSIVVDCGAPEICDAPTPLSEELPALRHSKNDPCIDGFGTEALWGSVTDRCVRPL